MSNNQRPTTEEIIAEYQQQLTDQISCNGSEILEYVQSLDQSQILGFQALIYLALREQTSIAYQHEEMGFSDIPPEIISFTDALAEEEQLYLAAQIADEIFENSVFSNAPGLDKNAEALPQQDSGVLANDD